MITLFGNLESGNVHKVQLILRHAQRPYRRVDMSQTRNEPRHPDFRNLNPIGKIPAVLLDNGDVVSESNAILFHFSNDSPLWPEQTRAQTEVLRWLFFEQYSHEPTISVIRYLTHFSDDPQQHVAQVETLQPKAHHALEVMENQLRKTGWIASENCTVADYALYPYTRVSHEAGFDLAKYPSITSWLSRVEARPGFIPMGTDGAEQTLSFAQYFQTADQTA